MADVTYRVELDDKQVLQALRIIDANMRKLATQGDASFQKVGKSANVSGVQIGLTSGIVQELTRRFIDLAAQGARAFVEIAAGGVQLNRELEVTKIALTNIFEGNEQAAQAFIDQVDTLAARLRVDFQELRTLGKGILPDIGDAQQTLKIMEQFVILGRDAGQNWTSIRIALEEAATGQFTSLQRRLNIPAESIRRIKVLSEEVGIADALIQVLGDRIQKAGLNLDDFADTFEAQMGAIRAEGRQLQSIFGEPIFEELKEQAADFLSVLEEKEPGIERVAEAFGELAARIVEIIGTNLNEFLRSLDFEKLEAVADAFTDVANAADLLASQLRSSDINEDLETTRTILEAIRDALVTAAQAAALLRADLARQRAENESLIESTKGTQQEGLAALGVLKETTDSAKAGQDAYNQSILESITAFEEYNRQVEKARQRTEERGQTTKETTQADIDAGDAILKRKKDLEEMAEAEAKAADATEKIAKATNDLIKDLSRERLQIEINAQRKRLDNEIKNAEEIEDIWRKHYQELGDAARDLGRDEEDIRRKAARDEIEIERDAAGERLQAETDYRRELQRIRDRFNMAAQEAERNNDAQAFLSAMRQRDSEMLDARRTRNESVEDAKTKAIEQRAALQEQLAFELEDARIANGRKLEDLQLSLQRELDEQAIKAQRAEAAHQLDYQRELQDFARKEAQRLADLQSSLTKEVEMIRTAEALKRQIRVDEARATIAQVQSIMQQIGLRAPTTGTQTSLGSSLPPPSGRRLQAGGPAEEGRPYIVGERGPELFVPDRRGYVVPNAALGPAVSNISTVFNNQRSIAPTFNVAESLFSDPVAVRKLQNLILGVMVEAG